MGKNKGKRGKEKGAKKAEEEEATPVMREEEEEADPMEAGHEEEEEDVGEDPNYGNFLKDVAALEGAPRSEIQEKWFSFSLGNSRTRTYSCL